MGSDLTWLVRAWQRRVYMHVKWNSKLPVGENLSSSLLGLVAAAVQQFYFSVLSKWPTIVDLAWVVSTLSTDPYYHLPPEPCVTRRSLHGCQPASTPTHTLLVYSQIIIAPSLPHPVLPQRTLEFVMCQRASSIWPNIMVISISMMRGSLVAPRQRHMNLLNWNTCSCSPLSPPVLLRFVLL